MISPISWSLVYHLPYREKTIGIPYTISPPKKHGYTIYNIYLKKKKNYWYTTSASNVQWYSQWVCFGCQPPNHLTMIIPWFLSRLTNFMAWLPTWCANMLARRHWSSFAKILDGSPGRRVAVVKKMMPNGFHQLSMGGNPWIFRGFSMGFIRIYIWWFTRPGDLRVWWKPWPPWPI